MHAVFIALTWLLRQKAVPHKAIDFWQRDSAFGAVESKRHNSTRSATSLKRAKLVPDPSYIAPSEYAFPRHTSDVPVVWRSGSAISVSPCLSGCSGKPRGVGYLLNHLGVLMQIAHPCSNETSSDRPGQSEDLPGRELSGRLDSAFGVSDFRLRCSQPRLASCGNSVQSLALRACRGQRVLRVTDAQEPSDKRAADNDPVRSRGATVIVERDKDGNASGAEKINFTEVEDQARCLPNEPVGVVVEAVDVGRVDVTSNPHNGHLVSAISAHLGAVAIDGAAAGVGREATGTGVRRERSDHQ